MLRLALLLSGTVALWAPQVHAAAGAKQSQEPVFGGVIRVAINSDIRSTNPGVRRDGNTDTVLYHIGESLVAYREDLSVGPLLASRIEISEDHRTFTFFLRQGVRFHNGAELTSEQVKWTWDRLLDPETGFRCLDYYDGSGASGLKIESVDILGRYKIAFRLNKPSALFLDRMASIPCQTPILHPESVAPDGSWRRPVATGPYRLGEWDRGKSVTLLRFDGYVPRSEPRNGLTGKKIAYADRLVFQVTPDRIIAKSSVYAGNIDLLFAMPLSAHNEVQRRVEQRGDVKIYHQDTLDWTVLLMQTKDPLLSDVRMRRAIAHAISTEMVTTFATYGLAPPNPSAIARATRFWRPYYGQWLSYDPELARELAREAGYEGQVLTIQANRKFSYMLDNAVAIQAMLNAAGFNARIEVYDWATQLTRFLNGDFQLSSFGYSARSHPALLYGNFTGSKEVRESYQWDDPLAIRLIEKLETAFTDAETRKILDRLHREMIRQVPIIGLYNDHVIDISRANLHGYEPWAFGRPRLWGVWISHAGAGR
ncbi:MAG TPA: ABC transporter substrate-binding protein [Woeseiaceae bacterium]|nr:ABC transporter substrate-binding protein [Woeseiaceae bacterium]